MEINLLALDAGVLNVAAAHEQLGRACCVVDAGSAITVDCDDAGAFIGGLPAPGAAAQFEALHRLAPHLSLARLQRTDDAGSSAAGAGRGWMVTNG